MIINEIFRCLFSHMPSKSGVRFMHTAHLDSDEPRVAGGRQIGEPAVLPACQGLLTPRRSQNSQRGERSQSSPASEE